MKITSIFLRLGSFAMLFLFLVSFLPLLGCSGNAKSKGKVMLTDADGTTFYVSKDHRVVSAYGSFAECWLLSGGSLVGVTEDAISERKLELDEGVQVIGSVKSVNLEVLIALEPDFVILSADLTAHRQLANELRARGIAAGLFRVDSFSDYAELMRQFCLVSGRYDLYKAHVTEVKAKIDSLLSKIPTDKDAKTALIMRAYSNGIKVKTDNIAEDIAKELGCISLAEQYPSSLTDLSIEKIITADPVIILVLTMGNEEDAIGYLKEYVEENPAFSSLRAVKNGSYVILPKALFHYKPNNKWNESYEYLAKIVYPELFK